MCLSKKVLFVFGIALCLLLGFAKLTIALEPVKEISSVCMVNDKFMGIPQIEVHVHNKTYYGCCNSCKQTLRHTSQSRYAIDPFDGSTVDKAQAFVAKDSKNNVYYFKDESNYSSYHSGKEQSPQ